MIHRAAWMILCLAPLLAACSAIPQRAKQQETQQQFMTYAGAPVERFSYLGQYNDWRALSSAQLVVWTSINDAYLVTVREPCIHLQFTGRIGLTSTAGTVTNRLDSVLVDRERCQITEIRPVDYRKMRADLRRNKP